MQALRKFCDKYEILLIVDEVQSGFGRSGKMFSIEHFNVEPDILIMAKGMGSGLPISAIGASSDLMSKWRLGTHGGTYGGGSVIPMAAANATIQTILDEKLVQNAKVQGDYLITRLEDFKKKYPSIGDNRGLGLMIGTEFTDINGNPDPKKARLIQMACLNQNLLLLTCGTYLNVIRWIPPLIITKNQIKKAIDIFHLALKNS
jgi:4-aminobutyrate aminotransferase-like enzyme